MNMKPILFLDFDRTLFDTDLFYDWLGEKRFERLLQVSTGEIAPPDFSVMLYADTLGFLKSMRTHARLVILTYDTNAGLQRKKLQGAGVVPLVDDIIITSGNKGEEAHRYLMGLGESGFHHAFVDDRADFISDMKDRNPGIRTFLIRREGDFDAVDQVLAEKADVLVRDLGEVERILTK